MFAVAGYFPGKSASNFSCISHLGQQNSKKNHRLVFTRFQRGHSVSNLSSNFTCVCSAFIYFEQVYHITWIFNTLRTNPYRERGETKTVTLLFKLAVITNSFY